jgi:hypothetical protein
LKWVYRNEDTSPFFRDRALRYVSKPDQTNPSLELRRGVLPQCVLNDKKALDIAEKERDPDELWQADDYY